MPQTQGLPQNDDKSRSVQIDHLSALECQSQGSSQPPVFRMIDVVEMGFKDAHLNITNIYLQTIESTQSIQVMGPCFELPYTALKCVKIKVLIGKKIIVVKCIQ